MDRRIIETILGAFVLLVASFWVTATLTSEPPTKTASLPPSTKSILALPLLSTLKSISLLLSLNTASVGPSLNISFLVPPFIIDATIVASSVPSEASIIQRAACGSDDGFYCKSYTVDQLIYKMNLINNVEFIKIDAEGAEFEILLGSQNTLKNFKPIIYLEVTRKESEIRNLLQNNNYLIYHFLNKNMTVAPENLLHTSILAIPKNYN